MARARGTATGPRLKRAGVRRARPAGPVRHQPGGILGPAGARIRAPHRRIWTRLGELGFADSSLQFAAMFTPSFIPFLMLLSVVPGKDLSRALVTRSEFSAEASRDVTSLFTHGRTALTSLSIIGIVLVIFGAESVSRILGPGTRRFFALRFMAGKPWRAAPNGWPGYSASWHCNSSSAAGSSPHRARRGLGRAVPPRRRLLVVDPALPARRAGHLAAAIPAGLVTAICYTGVGVYIVFFGSSSILSDEASYGPIGAVMTLLTIEVGLGVALHLGAVIGATIQREPADDPARPVDA
jgi:membrane protein